VIIHRQNTESAERVLDACRCDLRYLPALNFASEGVACAAGARPRRLRFVRAERGADQANADWQAFVRRFRATWLAICEWKHPKPLDTWTWGLLPSLKVSSPRPPSSRRSKNKRGRRRPLLWWAPSLHHHKHSLCRDKTLCAGRAAAVCHRLRMPQASPPIP